MYKASAKWWLKPCIQHTTYIQAAVIMPTCIAKVCYICTLYGPEAEPNMPA